MATIKEMIDFACFVHENAVTVESYGENEITFELEDVNATYDGFSLEERLAQVIPDESYEVQYGDGNWVTIEF